MTAKPEFLSIAELALTKGVTVPALACALETLDYYTWDRFGRIKLILATSEDGASKAHRDELLDELAGGYKCWEFDEAYFAEMQHTTAACSLSGWPKGQLPNFTELQQQWNDRQQVKGGVPDQPAVKPPAAQSAVWDILRAALLSEKLDEGNIQKWIHTDEDSPDMAKLQIALGLNGKIAEVSTNRIKKHLSTLWPK